MKVLVLSSTYPLPENTGGRMRTMNFVRFFRDRGTVDIVYRTNDSPKPYVINRVFEKEFHIPDRLEEGDRNGGRIRLHEFGERMMRLLGRRPYILAEWSARAERDLASLVVEGDYDIILCRYIFDSRPLFRLPRKYRERVVIDFDDIFSDSLFEEYVRHRPGLYANLKRNIQKRLITDYQRRCLNFGAGLFCSTSDERKVASGRSPARTFIVPNVYPCTMRSSPARGDGYERRHTLLFVGSLDYGPNIRGVTWFLETIFPEVRERNGNVRMKIVGRRPADEIRKLCDGRIGVDLHADVDDVGSFYGESGVVVVPINSGGGTRIKILEAAMAGRPVLSTPVGAYGLECTDGMDIAIFKDKYSFLDAYGRFEERAVYESCVKNLRAVVETKYSPAAFEKAMKCVIDAVA